MMINLPGKSIEKAKKTKKAKKINPGTNIPGKSSNRINKKFINRSIKTIIAIILLILMVATVIISAIMPFVQIANAASFTELPYKVEANYGEYKEGVSRGYLETVAYSQVDSDRPLKTAAYSQAISEGESEHSWYSDVPEDSAYAVALKRLTTLGIFQGGADSSFRPDDILTREELAKLLIVASALEETVNSSGVFGKASLTGENIFPDIPAGRWSSKYIKAVVEYGYMGGMADGNFHPTRGVSYAEMCTILVKVLGYTELDLKGEWPVNYIDKAIKLGLCEGFNFSRNDGLPRWAAAIMIDRLLETSIKSTSPGGESELYSEHVGLYTKHIILADSETSSRLADNQVQTDKGIFYAYGEGQKLSEGQKLEVGNVYQLKVENDTIKKVYNKLKSTVKIRVESFNNNKITYVDEGERYVKEDGSIENKSMVLSEKTTFYYNGAKQNYDNLKNILKKDMIMIFAYNDDRTGFDYAVIIEPEDYRLGTYIEAIVLADSKTSKKLAFNQVLTDKGTYKLTDEAYARKHFLEPGATVGFVINDDNEIVKVSAKINPTTNITIESAVGTKITYKENKEINPAGTGMNTKDAIDAIKEPTGTITGTMTLPEKIKYYYNGTECNYEDLKDILKRNTSIVFSHNSSNYSTNNSNNYSNKDEYEYYEYAVVFDPSYSEPEKVESVALFVQRNQSLADIPVIRDGKVLSIKDVKQNDIVYLVTDIWDNNKYMLVVDDTVNGEITNILPDKITPKTVHIDGVNYELGEYFNPDKLNHSFGAFDVGDNIIAFLGYDGKVIDMEYPGNEDNSDFAIVLNSYKQMTSDSKGSTRFIHTAKLLTADGRTATYDTVYDASSYKGKLVRFRDVNGKLVLDSVTLVTPGNVKINKGERKINSEYVADNVKVFNLISNEEDEEARAEILEFSELPDGQIPKEKILYINRAGDFQDINVIMTSDIYNEKQKPAIVKDMNIIETDAFFRKSYTYTYTLLVGDKEYQYNKAIGNAGIGSIVDVELSSKGIEKVGMGKKAEAVGNVIQAMDTKRIKIQNEIHWLKPRFYIYFINESGEISKVDMAAIEKNKNYESVSIFYDKDKEEGGKVEAIVIKE